MSQAHVVSYGKMIKNVMIRILYVKRPCGMSRHRWLDRIVKNIGAIDESQRLKDKDLGDREGWRSLVEVAKSVKCL